MIFLAQNIKHLRRKQNWTQQKLADKLNVKRALVGSYEEGRASPKLAVLLEMAGLFQLSVDQLIGVDLEKGIEASSLGKTDWQVFPIVVNDKNEELIPIIPVKASAGYLNGHADPEFIGSLPRFDMPVPELSKERSYRVFQIQGDSMLPVLPGSYVFCEFITDIDQLKDNQAYILVTKDEGLVYKRVAREQGNQFLLKSDNPLYETYSVSYDSIFEIWKAIGILSFELPAPEQPDWAQLPGLIRELKNEIRDLRT